MGFVPVQAMFGLASEQLGSQEADRSSHRQEESRSSAIAINKGEIVKRLLYNNPDADFVFCAGDDKTDEDMFRALRLFPVGSTVATMAAPISASSSPPGTPSNGEDEEELPSVQLAITAAGCFATTVGHPSKKTLAVWHVTSAPEVVESMLKLVNGPDYRSPVKPAGASTEHDVEPEQ